MLFAHSTFSLIPLLLRVRAVTMVISSPASIPTGAAVLLAGWFGRLDGGEGSPDHGAVNVSVYGLRSSGEDNLMERVSEEAAREVFAALDWSSEVPRLQAAEEAGEELPFPEFTLSENDNPNGELRILNIYPVREDTVSFRYCTDEKSVGAQELPNSEVPRLLHQFFSDGEDAFDALSDKWEPSLRELDDAQFFATIVKPMRPLRAGVIYRQLQTYGVSEYFLARFGLTSCAILFFVLLLFALLLSLQFPG